MKFEQPAFPTDTTPGMDLRDYFAAMAMQAILSGNEGRHENRWELASDAYRMADAMLEVRDEQ